MAIGDLKQRARWWPWVARYRYAENAASELRRLGVLATNTHADVRIAKPVRLGPRFRLYMPQGGTFIVHPGCDFRGDFTCEIQGGGRVEIMSGTTFTSSALLQISTRLTIGKRVTFGQAVMIADGNHRWRDPDKHLLDQGYDFTPIDIGDGATVLTKCTILAPLGERALVAAHSVVTRPAPAYCLVAGTPARVKEYYGPPELRPPDLELG